MSESQSFREFFNVLPKDRTGHSNFINTDVELGVTPLPSKITSPSLQDCIDDRLANIASKPNLALLWSGGIDSTLVFYALIDAGVDFTVYGNDTSLSEHPELGKKIKSGYFSSAAWQDLTDLKEADFDGKTIITGEIGDQCVGSDYLLTMSLETRSKDYKTRYSSDGIQIFTEAAKDILNRQDMTVGEMTWAFNFFWKYDAVTERMAWALYDGNIDHFFNSELFQCYALNNYQTSTAFNRNTDYKTAYKDWIFSHDNDDFYRKHKLKIGSLKRLLKTVHNDNF